ncbi:MAG: xylulokinase [Chloroflexi bacterium]|nr:xylulokinase [Chloroflexota bacterium]
MTRRAFLGVDCGTQSTKVLVVDANTEDILGSGQARHELIARADGTREQDPDWWVAALQAAARQALPHDVEVVGIGISGQQHGLVCLDSADRPLRHAKLWNDTTTVAECAQLTEAVGGSPSAIALTGNTFLAGYTAPKVLWLRDHEPAAYAATQRMCLPHDYLNLWLTGTFATEPGDASGTAYFDVRQRSYSPTVLSIIDKQRDWPRTLPPIVPSLSIMGQLRPEAAAAIALSPGIPVSAGGGDNMMAALGVGAVVEGPVVVSLGTSGTGFAHRDRPAVDPLGEASAFCDSAGGWLPLVTTLNCTVATEWIRGLFGLDHAGLDAALAASPAGARGLTFLPHLDGERTPNVPTGAGVFAGLRAEHRVEDLARGVVEGVTFGLSYALRALQRSGVHATEITLVGGGAGSDAWAQLCADVFALPVVRPPQSEAGALGAARQARWAIDGVPVTPKTTGGRRFEPVLSPAIEDAAQRANALRDVALANGL